MIFIFRHYDSQKRIIIYAESYLEAKEALFELNPWADRVYNILEYKMYDVDFNKYCDILNIEEEYGGYPRILSEDEFTLITEPGSNVLLDKQFKDIHNTKVLTTNYSPEMNLMGTTEYINKLKENTDIKESVKRQIAKMQNIIGDIWKLAYYPKTKYLNNIKLKDTYYIYGLGRQQIIDLFNKQKNKSEYSSNYLNIEPIIKPNLNNVIGFNSVSYSDNDIKEYNMLIDFMKRYNIKKFPFDTQVEDLKQLELEKAGN